MAKHKTRRRAPFKPAIEGGEKGVVVSVQRARWKHTHNQPSEKMIQMLRFIWMRKLTWEDRFSLNGNVLGALMRAGLVTVNADRSNRMYARDYREFT